MTRDRTRPRQERERPYAGSRGPGVRQRDGEVGSEGGTPGDVELDIDWGAGAGSEAGETWQPTNRKVEKVVRDETGEGRGSR
ncbi:MAG: hypothetical protein AUH43_25380 [Acidobacteria bacterium 13_1_40CM_65_14]|nr:MAG: hypothetical protein AUH43_25380 [Acidobacteria bacterium 13_1_40CM_65_14]OLC82952.1 MAG: hypothetical protein AUH72_05445 [Acidobacteria bacterium 13_1_40CM_4_65_8]OLE78860.1 MAG: hypothetical protein AUF76_18245 [Acidobacteria bacterium 13_1_20CM_2_65_9]